MGWVRSLHVQFLTAAYGRAIGGWFSIGLLAMLLTGIPIWWPRKGEVTQGLSVDPRARGVVLYRQLHGATAAWIVGVLLVLTVTAIAMAFPRTARDVLGLEQREPPGARPAVAAAPIPADDVNRAVRIAQELVPDKILRSAFLPARPADPVRLIFQPPGETGAVEAVQVQVDLATGQAGPIEGKATRRRGESLLRWMHDLHTSHGIGDWWSLLSGVAGPAMTLLALTGSLMWCLKRSKRRLLADARQEAAAALQQTVR